MDLFDPIDTVKRKRLASLGWMPEWAFAKDGKTLIVKSWTRPDGARLTEDEAFRQLDAMDVLESDREVE